MGLAARSLPNPGLRCLTPRQEIGAHGSLPEICLVCRVSAPLTRGRAQSSHYSKLEKADILEMTVRFLQELPASSCAEAAPGE